MPVVSIVNPKGGAGKSTLCLVIALSLAERGGRIAVLDTDEAEPIKRWSAKRSGPISVFANFDDNSLIDGVRRERARNDLVLIDTQGVASVMATRAIGLADLVLVPLQPSVLDTVEAEKAILVIRSEERMREKMIGLRAVLTRTSPQVPTKRTKEIVQTLEKIGVATLRTQLHGRVAYENLFYQRATFSELNPKSINGVAEAIANATTLADEVVAVLRAIKEERAVA